MADRFTITLAAAVLLAPGLVLAEAGSLEGFAFGQFTAEEFDLSSDGENGLDFDRMRAGLKWRHAAWSAALQLDFNAEPTRRRRTGTLDNFVQDLYVGYRFSDAAQLKAGQFKTPLGMDFNTSGQGLDITKRGLEVPLVLQRNVGVMLSGRKLFNGVGYDIGLFNPAGRSGAVFGVDGDPFDQEGDDKAWAGRLLFDPEENLHFEVAIGQSEDAGGADGTEDYEVFDIAASYQPGPWSLKAEFIQGENTRGVSDADQQVWYLHTGYQLTPAVELVARHYAGDMESVAGDSDLTNTYVGANLFLSQWWPEVFGDNQRNGRVQINYVIAGGDEERWNGLGGFRGDAILVQLQLSGSTEIWPGGWVR